MVLAAGVGERMLPLTLTQPKPAIPVLGRPLAVQILIWLGRHGVDEAVLNLHHLPEVIRRRVGPGGCHGLPPIHYIYEGEILGTAGGLRNAAGLLRGGSPIVVCNSDFLSDIDLAAVLETHRSAGLPVTLVLATARPGYSEVSTDAAGRVLSLAGKPIADPARVTGRWLFTGCQVIDEEVLERIPAGRPSDLLHEVWRPLAAQGRLGSHAHDGFWWEFGSPELYLEGSLRLLDSTSERRRRICAEQDPVRPLGGGHAAVGPGAEVDPSARVRGTAALGYATHVSADAVIEDSVVMPEAWIGPSCRLKRSVIAEGVELPAGFAVERALVCLDPDPPALELPPATRRMRDLLVYDLREPVP